MKAKVRMCTVLLDELQSLPKVVGTLRTLDMTGVIFLLHSSIAPF